MNISTNLLMKHSKYMSIAERDALMDEANKIGDARNYYRAAIPYGSCERCKNLRLDKYNNCTIGDNMVRFSTDNFRYPYEKCKKYEDKYE